MSKQSYENEYCTKVVLGSKHILLGVKQPGYMVSVLSDNPSVYGLIKMKSYITSPFCDGIFLEPHLYSKCSSLFPNYSKLEGPRARGDSPENDWKA